MGVLDVAAEVVAEKFAFRPSGVKTPQENAGLMSCLKARPTKLKTFSATSLAAEVLLLQVSYRPSRRIDDLERARI